jgi:hypothetical protein
VLVDTELQVLFSGPTWQQLTALKLIVIKRSSITHDDEPFRIEEFRKRALPITDGRWMRWSGWLMSRKLTRR